MKAPMSLIKLTVNKSVSFSLGLLWWLSSKESACNAEDLSSIPGSGRSPGEGNGNPFQYSCWENSMDRSLRATVYDIAESDMA